MNRIYIFIIASLVLTASAAHGQDQSAPTKGPQINVKIDPQVSKANNEYDETVKKLAPAQQQDLKALDQELAAAVGPKVDLKISEIQFNACAKSDPGFGGKYKMMMQNYRLQKNDDIAFKRRSLLERIKKIDYIDKSMLGHHLGFQDALMTQMAAGLAMAATSEDKNGSLCDKFKSELETGYKSPYVLPDAHPLDINIIRDGISGRTKECTFGMRKDLNDGKSVSTSVHFESESISFSAKIADKNTGFLPVSDMWINFGNVDTRMDAHMGQPNGTMLMGILPPSSAASILSAVRDGSVVFSASTPDGGPYRFTPAHAEPDGAERLAACVGLLHPESLDALHAAGFRASPDPSDAKAMSAPKKEFIYNVTPMSAGDNPVGCIWQTKPHTESDGFQAIAAILVYGAAKQLTNNTEFWMIGGDTHSGGRASFTDFQVKIKTGDGKTLEPAKMTNAKSTPGQVAKITLMPASASGVVNAIAEHGMDISATYAEGKSVSYTLPPPEPESLEAYNKCLDSLKAFEDAHPELVTPAAQ